MKGRTISSRNGFWEVRFRKTNKIKVDETDEEKKVAHEMRLLRNLSFCSSSKNCFSKVICSISVIFIRCITLVLFSYLLLALSLLDCR